MWRLFVPAVTAALLAAAIAAAAPARADAACEADYCTTAITEPDGRYQLTIAANLVGYFYPVLDGCTWDVEAVYGDGSEPGEYVFSEASGLEAEHTYPEPGVYAFHAYATEGLHDGTSDACPDLHIEATVIYPEPVPPEEPGEPEPEGPAAQPPAPGGAAGGALRHDAAPPPAPPAVAAIPYWRECRGGIRAHRVRCRRAHRVIGAAHSLIRRARSGQRLAEGAIFEAAGFSCRLRQDESGWISCWRNRQRVLGT